MKSRIEAAPSIPRRRADAEGKLDFAALRRLGLEFVQDLAGHSWTDFNLHDPGVTLLEALCFSLTEQLYRAGEPVAAQLSDEDGRIDYERQGLIPAPLILSCRPTTAADYRDWLLDQVAGLADLTLAPRRGAGAGARTRGALLELTLRLHAEARARQGAEQAVVAAARLAYHRRRNLGEDLHEPPQVVGRRLCTLHAQVEVSGARDAAAVLAELLHRVADHIDALPQRRSLAGQLEAQAAPEQVFDGPPVAARCVAGVADDEGRRIVMAELAAQMRQVDGVQAVHHVALAEGEAAPSPRAVAWRNEHGVLALRLPRREQAGTRARSAALVGIRITRRGADVHVDERAVVAELEDRFALHHATRDLRARAGDAGGHGSAGGSVNNVGERGNGTSAHGGGHGSATPQAGVPELPLPSGHARPAPAFISVQRHLPAAYGLGEWGPPPEADAQTRERMRQFGTYTTLFDQLLADAAAQAHHLRELFVPATPQAPARWWQPLGEAQAPGFEALFARPRTEVFAEVFAPLDRAGEQRQRALDQLLALYGQTYAQNTQRQFLGFLSTAECERFLLENKAAFVRELAWLSRQRAAAPDLTTAPDKVIWPGCAFQRIVALLLGFDAQAGENMPEDEARAGHSLCDATLAQGLRWVDQPPREDDRPAWLEELNPEDPARLRPLEPPAKPAAPLGFGAPGARPPKPAPAELLRLGVDRQRYRWLPDRSGNGLGQLLLGPAQPLTQKGWRALGQPVKQKTAALLADSLRQWLLAQQRACEGLHVIEHVLLRRRSSAAASKRAGGGGAGPRLTVVFPAYTARTAQPAFQRFAEETVRLNAPAHVAVRCLWLDFDAMSRLEAELRPWWAALRHHVAAPNADSTAALDKCSERVAKQLRDHLRRERRERRQQLERLAQRERIEQRERDAQRPQRAPVQARAGSGAAAAGGAAAGGVS